MLKGIRKRITRRKQDHGDTLVATNGSLSDDRGDSSHDGTVNSVVTPTKAKTLGNDPNTPAAAIFQLTQSTDDDDDIYEASSVSSDERENQRKPATSQKNTAFIQDELEALRIRQLARNLRKDFQEIESQSTSQLSPLATSATEAFYLKQKEQKKEWKKKQKDSRNFLTSYRGAAGARKDDSIKTKNYIRSHAPSSGSGSPMDNFYLQQRAMNQEWKQKQRDANAYLHRYRGYILEKSSNGVSYEELLVWQKQAAAIPLPPSPCSNLDKVGDMTIDGIGPMPTLSMDDRPSGTFGKRLVPLKPRSALTCSPTGQENMVQSQQHGDHDEQIGIQMLSTVGETNGDNQATEELEIVVRASAETDMTACNDTEATDDEDETVSLEESSDVMKNENVNNIISPNEKVIGIEGEGLIEGVSPPDCARIDAHEPLASNVSDTELIEQSREVCTTDTKSVAIVKEDERAIISMTEPTLHSLAHLSHEINEKEEIPEGPGNFIKGLANSEVEPYCPEIADYEREATEEFLFENDAGSVEKVDDFDDMLQEILDDECLTKGAETALETPACGNTSEVSTEAKVVCSRDHTSKIPKRISTHRIIEAKSNECILFTPNKVKELSKAASRRTPTRSAHPRYINSISSLNDHRTMDASVKKSDISPKFTPSRAPSRRSDNASKIVSPHAIRTPIPRTSSPTRLVSITTSARSSHKGSYRSPRLSGQHGTPDTCYVNCTGKLVLDLHESIDGCDNCLAFATPAERRQFQQDGHHYRVNRVRGGCPRSCSIFPRNDNEPPVRLCRQCFYGTHYTRTPVKKHYV